MDTEGLPLKECSAIEVDGNTYKILDVYHKFANTEEMNPYAHKYVHGLNNDFLSSNGFETEVLLIADFKAWLDSKSYRLLLANDPATESILFKPLYIEDVRLPSWKDRIHRPYHAVANRFKELNIPILNTSCSSAAHSDFRIYPCAPRTESQVARFTHGHHCSLYDCYELFLYYILECNE